MANHRTLQEAEEEWFPILLPKETGLENISQSISIPPLNAQCRKFTQYCSALPCALCLLIHPVQFP